MTVNDQMFASWTQEKCAVTLNVVLQVTANSFVSIKLKHLRESNKLAMMIMSNIQTNYEVISNGYVHRKLAGKLSICFSCFQSSSWWCLREDCPIYVSCEIASCSRSVYISFVSLKQAISCWLSLMQNMRATLHPNVVHFHVQNFIWWCFEIL